MTQYEETKDVVSKMIHALRLKDKDIALGYLEVFVSDLINDYVTDPIKLEMLRIRMLNTGINALLDMK